MWMHLRLSVHEGWVRAQVSCRSTDTPPASPHSIPVLTTVLASGSHVPCPGSDFSFWVGRYHVASPTPSHTVSLG